MRHGIFLPIFGEMAEPAVCAELAARAEAAGWDGVFVWDHMAYRAPVVDIADPWVTLAAIACATTRVRIGPLVTPLPRRRPHKVARETVSIDRLSGGRLVLGVGLGGDPGRELSALGEELEPVRRGVMLNESLDVLAALWSGQEVHHDGQHFTVDGSRFGPTPVQQPRPPVWVAARYPNRQPLVRAAKWDGLFPVEVERPSQLAELVEQVTAIRDTAGAGGPYDVVISTPADDDPARWEAAGATWWLAGFSPFTATAAEVARVVDGGPGQPNVG